jgi:hypothetical protein
VDHLNSVSCCGGVQSAAVTALKAFTSLVQSQLISHADNNVRVSGDVVNEAQELSEPFKKSIKHFKSRL